LPGVPRSQSMDESNVPKRTAVAVPMTSRRRMEGEGLSSSFDLSFLNSEHRDSQLLTPTVVRYSASWDEVEKAETDSCKRTKFGGFDSSELPPTTLRKLVRRTAPDSPQQQPSTPAPAFRVMQSSGSIIKKSISKQLTPASAKRHRAALHARRSPMRSVPPMTPRAACGNTSCVPTTTQISKALLYSGRLSESSEGIVLPCSVKRRPKISLGTTATAASTLLETTTDTIDSTDTLESSTPFRFTSFPASLPRISTTVDPPCPGAVRKRTSCVDKNLVYYSRDDDTHNTSVSSLQDEGNYACSDDDEKVSPICTRVARTRLNFMQVESPTQRPGTFCRKLTFYLSEIFSFSRFTRLQKDSKLILEILTHRLCRQLQL
jgi:hypothetical protein